MREIRVFKVQKMQARRSRNLFCRKIILKQMFYYVKG